MNEWIINNWRIIAIVVLMTLSVIDLGATFFYVNSYHKWQPEKDFALMENNPLLVFLWNNLGLVLGHIVGSIIILTLIYLVARLAHPAVIIILGLFLIWAMYNHFLHITFLKDLIIKYPEGIIPESLGK